MIHQLLKGVIYTIPIFNLQRRFCSNLGMTYQDVKAAQEAVQKSEELDIRSVMMFYHAKSEILTYSFVFPFSWFCLLDHLDKLDILKFVDFYVHMLSLSFINILIYY